MGLSWPLLLCYSRTGFASKRWLWTRKSNRLAAEKTQHRKTQWCTLCTTCINHSIDIHEKLETTCFNFEQWFLNISLLVVVLFSFHVLKMDNVYSNNNLLNCVCVRVHVHVHVRVCVWSLQKYPPKKEMVRAVSLQTGYMVQWQGPNRCILTYLAQVDPRGNHTCTHSLRCSCSSNEWFISLPLCQNKSP